MDDRQLLAHVFESMSARIAGRTPGVEGQLVTKADFAPPPTPAPISSQTESAPAPAAAQAPSGASGDLGTFMSSLSGVESGGRSNAQNARTGAYGTFQIMPSNWPSWAKEAGVDPKDKSAAAQQRVAEHKMRQYHAALGSWEAVAVAWYAGPAAAKAWLKNPNAPRFNRKQGKGNEPSINEYVAKVTRGMRRG